MPSRKLYLRLKKTFYLNSNIFFIRFPFNHKTIYYMKRMKFIKLIWLLSIYTKHLQIPVQLSECFLFIKMYLISSGSSAVFIIAEREKKILEKNYWMVYKYRGLRKGKETRKLNCYVSCISLSKITINSNPHDFIYTHIIRRFWIYKYIGYSLFIAHMIYIWDNQIYCTLWYIHPYTYRCAERWM